LLDNVLHWPAAKGKNVGDVLNLLSEEGEAGESWGAGVGVDTSNDVDGGAEVGGLAVELAVGALENEHGLLGVAAGCDGDGLLVHGRADGHNLTDFARWHVDW